jgi:RNase P/RNase MRP subunit p29
MTYSKTCTKCGQTKALDSFGKDKQNKTGSSYRCKECAIKNAASWASKNSSRVKALRQDYYIKNADALNAISKKYAADNPELVKETKNKWVINNPKKVKESAKKSRKLNFEKNKISIKRRKLNNPEKFAAYNKKWALANRETCRVNLQRRRAVQRGNGVYLVTKKEIANLYASPCNYCGAPSKHIDHIIPMSRGGTHSIGNLTASCASCNLSKGAKFITEWKKGN